MTEIRPPEASAAGDEDGLVLERGLEAGRTVDDAGAPQAGGPGVILFHRRRYAAGLFWSTGTAGQVDDEARLLAIETGHDLFVVRERDVPIPQFGISRSKTGHRSGWPVAAIAAAQGFLANALTLVEVDLHPKGKGWWLIAIRNATIISGVSGDVVFAEFEPAAEAFRQLVSGSTAERSAAEPWEHLYCPDEVGVAGSRAISIEEVLGPASAVPKLRRTKVNLSRMAIVPSVILLAYGAFHFGTAWWRAHELERAQAAVQARVQLERRARLSTPPPWATKPHALTTLEGCYRAMAAGPEGIGGWTIEKLDCANGKVAVQWRRRFGSFADLDTAHRTLGLDPCEPADNGQLGICRRDALALDARTVQAPAEGEPLSVREKLLWSRAQRLGSYFELRLIRRNGERLTPEITFDSATLTIQTRLAPDDWGAETLDLPGLVLTQIIFEPAKMSWTLTGVLYDNLKTNFTG